MLHLMQVAKLGALFLLVACSSPQSPPPRPQPQGQVVTEVGFVAVDNNGVADNSGELVIPPAKEQPPHVKLKLGHFINEKRGIGVTIDLISARTENIADIDPAKVRFDGDATIYVLKGQQATRDRIDFMRDRSRGRAVTMLHVWNDGRYAVYVPDPEEEDRSSEMIEVVRDADADPL